MVSSSEESNLEFQCDADLSADIPRGVAVEFVALHKAQAAEEVELHKLVGDENDDGDVPPSLLGVVADADCPVVWPADLAGWASCLSPEGAKFRKVFDPYAKF